MKLTGECEDEMYCANVRRKGWRAKRWLGPSQVLLTMQTAVKVAEKAIWLHLKWSDSIIRSFLKK